MGVKRTYKCNSCGYSAVINAGIDGGKYFTQQTHICLNCNILTDIKVQRERIKLMDMKYEKVFIIKDDVVCRQCSKRNFKIWNTDLCECPICSNKMEVDDSEGFWLWD